MSIAGIWGLAKAIAGGVMFPAARQWMAKHLLERQEYARRANMDAAQVALHIDHNNAMWSLAHAIRKLSHALEGRRNGEDEQETQILPRQRRK